MVRVLTRVLLTVAVLVAFLAAPASATTGQLYEISSIHPPDACAIFEAEYGDQFTHGNWVQYKWDTPAWQGSNPVDVGQVTITSLGLIGGKAAVKWEATVYVYAVFIKAGTGGNLYLYPPDGALSDDGPLLSPKDSISHITVCVPGDGNASSPERNARSIAAVQTDTTLDILVQGCEPGSEVDIYVDGSKIASKKTDGKGQFKGTLVGKKAGAAVAAVCDGESAWGTVVNLRAPGGADDEVALGPVPVGDGGGASTTEIAVRSAGGLTALAGLGFFLLRRRRAQLLMDRS